MKKKISRNGPVVLDASPSASSLDVNHLLSPTLEAGQLPQLLSSTAAADRDSSAAVRLRDHWVRCLGRSLVLVVALEPGGGGQALTDLALHLTRKQERCQSGHSLLSVY